ncbi:MAG TPA: MFS transporter [Rhodospirillales bacterium]|nr:MFS transporter [Rhodospirillales bacterium]
MDGTGWRQASMALAVVVAVIVPVNILLQRKRPEDLGLKADGEQQCDLETAAPATNLVVDKAWVETDWTPALAGRTSRFWWITLTYFTAMFAWYSVVVHQTAYLVEVGFDTASAATALGLVGLFGIVGQIGIGGLSDRVGREWAWTLALFGFALSYGALILLSDAPSQLWLYVMIITQGGLGYGLATIYGTITAEIFSGPKFATIFGMTSLAANLGGGAGPWVTGYIYDATGSYIPAFWLCIAMLLISAMAVWRAGPGKIRRVAGRASG